MPFYREKKNINIVKNTTNNWIFISNKANTIIF
jgi:hypothetical protein